MNGRQPQAFDVHELIGSHNQGRWAEFLNVETLRLGVYRLPAGGVDLQEPHAEDEVYYVIEGRAVLRAGDETRVARPGGILFVPARVPHRFEQIEEDLVVLVFFSGASPPVPPPR